MMKLLQVNHLPQPELLQRLEAVVLVMTIVPQSKGKQVSVIRASASSHLTLIRCVTQEVQGVPQDFHAGRDSACLTVTAIIVMESVMRVFAVQRMMECVTNIVHTIVQSNNDHELLLSEVNDSLILL